MGEFASKGVAGAGLGLGIAGTALGVLAGSNNGGGLLGGLFGGGGQISALQAEIAKLKSEKYSDKNDVEVYAQTRRENQDLGDRLLGNWIKPLSQEAAANRERIAVLETSVNCDREKAALREQLIKAEMEKRDIAINGKIDRVADHATCGISRLGDGLAALRRAVDNITVTHIPASAICPEVMPRWNAWEAPTAAAPATQPVTGTINVNS